MLRTEQETKEKKVAVAWGGGAGVDPKFSTSTLDGNEWSGSSL
jgi:hypothetical protein